MDDHRQAICYFTPHNHNHDQRQATMIIQQLRVLPHGHGHMLREYSLIPTDHMHSKPPVMSRYAVLTTHMSNGNPLLHSQRDKYYVELFT